MFVVEIIQHIFDDLPIRETHIASQAITQQPFEDRSSYGVLFFHQRRFQPLHVFKGLPVGQLTTGINGIQLPLRPRIFQLAKKCSASVTSSSSRHMPMASKFSSPSPMKSKRAWQDAHCDFCWCNCTSVRTLGRGFSEDAISSGTLGGGGGRIIEQDLLHQRAANDGRGAIAHRPDREKRRLCHQSTAG